VSPTNTHSTEQYAVRIPADIELPDKVLAGLNVRQVLILGGTGLIAASVYMLTEGHLPLPVIAAAVFPLVAIGCSLALGRRDGVSLDRLVLAAVDYLRRRKTLVAAPEGIMVSPAWCKVRGRLPGPLGLPVRAVREDGVMELADGGIAVLVQAGTVSFALRTAAEQGALVAFFGRWLNSLDASVQILVQARSADLGELIDGVAEKASQLPHTALEQAALEHVTYLEDLNASRDLLTRRVLVVIRDNNTATGPAALRARASAKDVRAAVVTRRAAEAVRSLGAVGINAELLDAAACTEALADALSPGEARPTGLANPDESITSNSITAEEVKS
jgi:hypothetical protein